MLKVKSVTTGEIFYIERAEYDKSSNEDYVTMYKKSRMKTKDDLIIIREF